MAVEIPETIRINLDDYHAKHVGMTTDNRQFFLTTPFVPSLGDSQGCEYVAVFYFDLAGKFLHAEIDSLGPRAELDKRKAKQAYDSRLASLGDVSFRDIIVAPFSVDRFGTPFGLIPSLPDHDEDEGELVVEIQPGNYMAFYEPWDGYYDT